MQSLISTKIPMVDSGKPCILSIYIELPDLSIIGTKLIQLPNQLDSSGIFIPIHYGLLNFCKQSFPARSNQFYLNEIRSVLWNKEIALWEQNPCEELAYLRNDIESIAGASENFPCRSTTEIFSINQGMPFDLISFPVYLQPEELTNVYRSIHNPVPHQ